MVNPRLHLIGLPHTQTVDDMVVCAFTAKLVKFAEMMCDDYPITIYSGEHNDAPGDEHVPLFTDEEQQSWYGESDPNLIPSKATFNAGDEWWRLMNARAIIEINSRIEPHDIILILGGRAQMPVAHAFPGYLSCEWAAGYSGVFSRHICFESNAWRHYLYGQLNLAEGRFFDTVIPNFFRPDDFTLSSGPLYDDGYLLYVGRLIQRKGIMVALDIAKRTGRKLILAGSGAKGSGPGFLETLDGCRLEGDIEYVGTVNAEERNKLMQEATAVLVPTTYIEPFGAVAVEAQLCGTPAITTDWGAFTETVDDHFRFTTLAEAAECVAHAADADPWDIQAAALERWSLDAVRPLYDRWFRRLSSLWADGWYSEGDTPATTEEAV